MFSKHSWSESFLDCIEDIPISKNIEENKKGCFNFDTDAGRIMIAEATTSINANDIIEYYKNILPSFGWQLKEFSDMESFIIYIRDNDVLKISIEEDKNRFYIISYNFLSIVK